MRARLLGRQSRTAVALCVLLTGFAARSATTEASPERSAAAPKLSIRWLAPREASAVSGTLTGSGCEVVRRDSSAVRKVVFYLDGLLVSTDTTAPYTCHIDAATLSGGTHILKARAYDATGNVMSAYEFVTTAIADVHPITVTLQGDSLTLGSWWRIPAYLGDRFELLSVSARIGRPAVKGLAILGRQRLGQIVVFALGTNDWWDTASAYRQDLMAVLRLIGPNRCLVVPTIRSSRRFKAPVNRILGSLAARYGPARMQLAAWAQAVAAGRVRLPDGTHPDTQAGWQLRAKIVAEAVRACDVRQGGGSAARTQGQWRSGSARHMRQPPDTR